MKCHYKINRHTVGAILNYFFEKDENSRNRLLIFDEVKLREEIKFNHNTLKVMRIVVLLCDETYLLLRCQEIKSSKNKKHEIYPKYLSNNF